MICPHCGNDTEIFWKMVYDKEKDLYINSCSDGRSYTSKDFVEWFDENGKKLDFGCNESEGKS